MVCGYGIRFSKFKFNVKFWTHFKDSGKEFNTEPVITKSHLNMKAVPNSGIRKFWYLKFRKFLEVNWIFSFKVTTCLLELPKVLGLFLSVLWEARSGFSGNPSRHSLRGKQIGTFFLWLLNLSSKMAIVWEQFMMLMYWAEVKSRESLWIWAPGQNNKADWGWLLLFKLSSIKPKAITRGAIFMLCSIPSFSLPFGS